MNTDRNSIKEFVVRVAMSVTHNIPPSQLNLYVDEISKIKPTKEELASAWCALLDNNADRQFFPALGELCGLIKQCRRIELRDRAHYSPYEMIDGPDGKRYAKRIDGKIVRPTEDFGEANLKAMVKMGDIVRSMPQAQDYEDRE